MDYIIGQSAKAGAPPGPAPGRVQGPGGVQDQGGIAPVADADIIVDGDQRSFMADVIEDSRRVPVLVDFWATWCGPCKTLTPALEKVTRAAGGRIKLVKIDIDANRALVGQLSQLGLPLQSVPTVAAFWQGQILDMFQGAQPESEIRRFRREPAQDSPAARCRRPTCWPRRRLAHGRLDSFEEAGRAVSSALLQEEPGKPRRLGRPHPRAAGARRRGPGRPDGARPGSRQARGPCRDRRRPQRPWHSPPRVAAPPPGSTCVSRPGSPPIADDHEARYELATALNATGWASARKPPPHCSTS